MLDLQAKIAYAESLVKILEELTVVDIHRRNVLISYLVNGVTLCVRDNLSERLYEQLSRKIDITVKYLERVAESNSRIGEFTWFGEIFKPILGSPPLMYNTKTYTCIQLIPEDKLLQVVMVLISKGLEFCVGKYESSVSPEIQVRRI